MPENAVVGGRDSDGCKIYVGRAFHDGDMLPAKVIPDQNVAYVCHSGEEHAKHDYEVSKTCRKILHIDRKARPSTLYVFYLVSKTHRKRLEILVKS